MDAIYTTQKEQFERTIRVFPSMEAMHAFNKNRLEEKAKLAAHKKVKEVKAPEAKAPEATVTTEVKIVSESVVDAIAVAAEVSADATVAAPAEPIIETDAAAEQSSKSVKRTTTKKKTKDSVK